MQGLRIGRFLLLPVVLLLSPASLPVRAAKHEVECMTNAGYLKIMLHDSWSPKGVERFLQLTEWKAFDRQIIYRVIPGFLMQFGVAKDPRVTKVWERQKFPDERLNVQPFKHGTVSFAGGGENSRTMHIFIAVEPQGMHLGNAPHETPIGQIDERDGMSLETLERIQERHKNSTYGDLTHLQSALREKGNEAAKDYPMLTKILYCVHAEDSPDTIESIDQKPKMHLDEASHQHLKKELNKEEL